MINQWWEQARSVELSRARTLVLSPEDLLIHLSLHFIKHRFSSPESGYNLCFISKGALAQLCDIIRAIRKYRDSMNWGKLQLQAKKAGMEDVVCMSLYLVKEIFGKGQMLSTAINEFLPGTFDTDIACLMLKKIFMKEDSFPPVTKFMIRSFGENTLQDGLKNIFRIMFPPPEILSDRYSIPVNSMKLYLCYFMRPFDVLFRHRETLSDLTRIKDDTTLTRWVCSQDPLFKGNN